MLCDLGSAAKADTLVVGSGAGHDHCTCGATEDRGSAGLLAFLCGGSKPGVDVRAALASHDLGAWSAGMPAGAYAWPASVAQFDGGFHTGDLSFR